MDIKKNITIIILNWNGWQDTIECLESVFQNNHPNYNVIVVDNDSNDESVQKIKEYCNGKIKIKSTFFRYDPNNKPLEILETEPDNNFQRKKIVESSSPTLFLIKIIKMKDLPKEIILE
jgi:GT2 family glycosyltransferase